MFYYGEVVHLQTCFTREPKHSKLSLSRWDQTVSFLIDFGSVRCGVLISSIHTTMMASPFYFASRDLADFNDPKRRSLNHRSDLNKCDRRSLINEEWNRCTSEAEPVPADELERIMCDRGTGKRPSLTKQHEIKADIATINSTRNDRHSRAAWAGGFYFPKKKCVATPANSVACPFRLKLTECFIA